MGGRHLRPLWLRHLTAADPRFVELFHKHGAPDFTNQSSAFASLAKTIVSQQLNTKVAAVIWNRLKVQCKRVTPENVLSNRRHLQSCGLSGQKFQYLIALAESFENSLSGAKLRKMSDDEVVLALTQVKGLGEWSAHMFLMFWLGRPNILPVGDLGIRKGFQLFFELDELPKKKHMTELASPWRPYSSYASWYMWKILP